MPIEEQATAEEKGTDWKSGRIACSPGSSADEEEDSEVLFSLKR